VPGPHGLPVRNKRWSSTQDSLPAPDAAASTASRPNVRDDGQRASQRGGTVGEIEVIWGKEEAECFLQAGWTGSITLIRLNK
jgi:hypothetical protein